MSSFHALVLLDFRWQQRADLELQRQRWGAVGSGDATLTINGAPVMLAANGAFIGWVANPLASAPSYELVAARGADTVTRTLRIRYPVRTPLLATGALQVDTASVSPTRIVCTKAPTTSR